jgi:lysophospholipase L1-like esterase
MPHQKKRKRQNPGRFLNMLILIFIVLIVFEGNLLINIFQKDGLKSQINSQIRELLANNTEEESSESAPETETSALQTESATESVPADPSIVPEQSVSVDDSYFADAVFIGDSRVEGFRNQSGITEGTFLTGVGMNVSNIFDTNYISMYNEQITVYQALIGTDYQKVYVMLGTNDLGEPDFNEFKESYRTCLKEIRKLAPNAIMYVIGVPYVEESKVEDSTYVNNANIDAVNEKILELCGEEGYYYLDVNAVLSDGNHSLMDGATSDGVHMYDTYCKIWLNYLKNHYVI